MYLIVGTPDEFVQALYSVGRGLRIAGDGSSTSSPIGGIGGLGFGRAGAAAAGFKSTSEDESDTNSPGQWDEVTLQLIKIPSGFAHQIKSLFTEVSFCWSRRRVTLASLIRIPNCNCNMTLDTPEIKTWFGCPFTIECLLNCHINLSHWSICNN